MMSYSKLSSLQPGAPQTPVTNATTVSTCGLGARPVYVLTPSACLENKRLPFTVGNTFYFIYIIYTIQVQY